MKQARHREHYISVLNKIISLLVFLATLIYFLIRILSYDISLNNRFLYFQLPFIILLSIITIASIINLLGNYFLTFVTIEDDYIKVENNFFIKNEIIIPFNNIHLYTTRQSIFLKPYKAKRLLLNSGSRNERAEIDITLKVNVINIIEEKINAAHCDKKSSSEGACHRLTNKWLLLYSILIPSKWIRPLGYTLSIITLIVITLVDNETLPFWLIVLSYIVSIIVSMGMNAVYIILKYYSFSLTKNDNCIMSITYGKLLNIRHFVLRDKINGILFKHDILSQITKTCHPFLYVAGYKNKTEEVSLPLLPVLKNSNVDKLILNFFREFHIENKSVSPSPKTKPTYYFPYIVPYIIIALPLTVFFIIVGEFLAVPVFILLLSFLLLNSRLAYKNTLFTQNDSSIYAKRGGVISSGFLCKKKDIQSIVYKNTVFNKKKDIYKFKIFIKAIKKKAFAVGYFNKEDTI